MSERHTCRNTIQKQLVVETVNALRTHPCAEEIYNEIQKSMPHISKATVYRNLTALAEKGVIMKIAVPNGGDRFDYNTMPHYHLLCSCCKKVFDIKADDIDIMGAVRHSEGHIVKGYSLLFDGLCANCAKQML